MQIWICETNVPCRLLHVYVITHKCFQPFPKHRQLDWLMDMFQSCYKECELLCRSRRCIYVTAELSCGCRWQCTSHGSEVCFWRCAPSSSWCQHVTWTTQPTWLTSPRCDWLCFIHIRTCSSSSSSNSHSSRSIAIGVAVSDSPFYNIFPGMLDDLHLFNFEIREFTYSYFEVHKFWTFTHKFTYWNSV